MPGFAGLFPRRWWPVRPDQPLPALYHTNLGYSQPSASSLNSNGRLCIYPDARKSCDRFANIKHNNYLPYVMGALYAREQHCNDALILNQYERICDSTIANLFLIRQQVLYDPALSEGCVGRYHAVICFTGLQKNGYGNDGNKHNKGNASGSG